MRNNRTDSGSYNRPVQIEKPAPYADNGSGGNANANVWVTVRSPMVHLQSGNFGRGLKRAYQYMQLYPTASHWVEMRYANDVAIDATMTLLDGNRRYQILGAEDPDLEHVVTVLALVEWQAKGAI